MESYARHLRRLFGCCLIPALLVALFAGSCEPVLTPTDPSAIDAGPPPPLPPAVDAGATVEEQCSATCVNMREINSREPCAGFDGMLSPKGTSCETVCVDTENSGTARFCPVALASARNCAELQVTWESCG